MGEQAEASFGERRRGRDRRVGQTVFGEEKRRFERRQFVPLTDEEKNDPDAVELAALIDRHKLSNQLQRISVGALVVLLKELGWRKAS
ncbi:MAG: hypothetical protein QGD94_08885 [Planctomycetia bacterium]|nr:hypothetical protein [Planctomycetia bacterium]